MESIVIEEIPGTLHCRVSAKREHINYESLVRPVSDRVAMSARRRAVLQEFRRWRWCCGPEPEDNTLSIQYRIPPKMETKGWSMICSHLTDVLESWVIRYVLWSYRTSFGKVILSFFFTFFVFVHFFALCIMGVAKVYHDEFGQECLQGWQFVESPYAFSENFVVAFSSSWETLTTVGFGTISPPAGHQCKALSYLLAFEAFVGILLASFCGAIFFTKLQRVEYSANVNFSSCMCLLYGSGLTDTKLDIIQSLTPGTPASLQGEASTASSTTLTAFPVIEMRLVNEREGEKGQIINASIECVATSLRLTNSSSSEGLPSPESEKTDFFDSGGVCNGIKSERNMEVKRKYDQVKITPSNHPYFAHGSWYFRHVLDEHSPLLQPRVKKIIVKSGGWPSDLNDHAKIRRCLSKDVFEINVIFKGTSNFTADSIFMMHTYTLEDIYIGWTFALLGYIAEKKSSEGEVMEQKIKVDLGLIHDIRPQRGEGSEPLGSRASDPDILTFLSTRMEEM